MTDPPRSLLSVPRYRDPCPFYRHGICTAPSLDEPTDLYTCPERCLTIQHYTCTIYMDAVSGRKWRGLARRSAKKRER